jgi:chromate reductase
MTGTSMAQQHLRNILAYLDMPTLGQPEAFIHAKEGLFDAAGNIGEGSREFLQGWMNRYAAWVKKHAESISPGPPRQSREAKVVQA